MWKFPPQNLCMSKKFCTFAAVFGLQKKRHRYMAKKKAAEEVKLVEKKLYGIVEKVVESVRDGSIDINQVFTREYASQFGDLEDREVLVKLRKNWIDSLPYINSVKEDDMVKEFGSVKLAEDDYEVNGVEVACYVLMNIFADFYITGEIFLHPEMLMAYARIPNVLFDKEALCEGREENFLYCYGNAKSIQFYASSNMESSDLNTVDPEQRTDLMQLHQVLQVYEDDNGEEIEDYKPKENYDPSEDDEEDSRSIPLGIYGFMASLIYVMFKDVIHRKIFTINWYDENWAVLCMTTIGPIKILNSDDLPTHLHIPAKVLFSEYLDRTLLSLRNKLAFEDIEFEDNIGYTMRKMLEIELAQSKKLHNSKLWNALPEPVRHMLMQYYALFIKELQKDLDLEVTGMPEIVEEMQKIDEKEVEEKTDAPLFCCITEYAYATGHAQQVEDELRSACVSGPKLMKCINTNEALGYLDTKNLTTATLYKLLNEHFGLKFGQRNLTKYRGK